MNLKILENILLFLIIICVEENYLKAIDTVPYLHGHHKLINSTIYSHRGLLNITASTLVPLDNNLKEPTQNSSENMNRWSDKKGKTSFITLLIIKFKVQMEYNQK